MRVGSEAGESNAMATGPALVLLQAPPWMELALLQLLKQRRPQLNAVAEPDGLSQHPDLVILCMQSVRDGLALADQLERLQERWRPAPLLLQLDDSTRLSRKTLLALPSQGLLLGADPDEFLQAVDVLLAGGRQVTLPPDGGETASRGRRHPASGLARELLSSALRQIDADLAVISGLLDPPPATALLSLLLEGRRRELFMARDWVRWLWAPLAMAWGGSGTSGDESEVGEPPTPGLTGLEIQLSGRDAASIWQSLQRRLEEASGEGLANHTGQVLALEGLHPARRRALLIALLRQLDQVFQRLRGDRLRGDALEQRWRTLQAEVEEAALRETAGSYVRLPREGTLEPVAPRLLPSERASPDEAQLTPSLQMLGPLVRCEPLLVDGQLLTPDEPRALLHLETLVTDWMLRTAERLSAEILSACGDWPELRRYLLARELVATRSLERLRNRLNNRDRWFALVDRPIQLYESRRELLCLQSGSIEHRSLTEARDRELRQLRGIPLLVTLALEVRDALAPQLRSLLKRLGNAFVVLLTQVIGRGIGLIGRGILQGMGRSFTRP